MGETAATLLAAALSLTAVGLLIYYGIRNLLRSFRNVKDAVELEVTRRRTIDSAHLRQSESKIATPPPSAPGQVEGKQDALPEGTTSTGPTTASAMAAHFQEEAKKSDDAHKARIRAHVDREVPPLNDDGREMIERGREARLAIKHIFPPRLPQRSMSYFGGLPIVPDNFDWPVLHNREGLLERLNFVAQINCSDLPPGPGRELFPDGGYLYFFAPLSGTFGPDAQHFVARYESKPVTQKWAPLDMPFTAKIEPADPMDRIWRGKNYYDRIEIELGWIEEPSDEEVAARADEGYAHEVATKIRAEKLDAFFGLPIVYDPLLSAHDRSKDAL